MLARKVYEKSRIELWHGDQTVWVIRPPGEDIAGQAGDKLSLIPLAGDASGVATQRLKYALHSETLFFGAGRGISNVFEGKEARVSLAEGLLLAVHTPHSSAVAKKPLNVAVQVLPLTENPIPIVDKAIEAIQASGVKYEVGPLETTIEGDNLDRLLEVAKAAHRACLEAGAGKVVTIIKIAEATEGTTIEQKVSKYRKPKR